MAFLDKKITELAFVSTPGQNDRIAIVNLGVTKQTSVSKFLQSVVAATGSFIENATIADNLITFTRADGTTFVRTIESASYAVSASHAVFSLDALSSSFATSASFAAFANDALSSSYAVSSSRAEQAESASYSVTSSYSLEALSSSFADFATSASNAISASFADFAESASFAVTASHALNVPETASYALTASVLDGPVTSASYAETSSYSLEALSASFAAFATSASFATTASFALRVSGSAQSDTASRVEENLTNGLGIETFSYNGSVSQSVQLDTASAHFTTGVSASQATTLTNLSASFSTSQTALSSSASTSRDAISSSAATSLTNYSSSAATSQTALSSSLTATDQAISSSNAALSASASTAREAISSSLASRVEAVSQSAATDINTNSASIAALSGSAAAERLNFVRTSSVFGLGDRIRFTKGDNSTYVNQILTSSFVKSVNGVNPAADGNVAVAIGSVETGLSSSIPPTADDADIWIVSGETGSNSGSNGKAFIYSTASGQWFEISNLDQAENDARYVRKTGDTMTGQLILPADPTLPLGAATRQYVDRAYISSSIVGTTLSLFTGTTPATEHSHSITNATSASYAVSASHAERADDAISASYAVSSSHSEFADNSRDAVSSSYAISASHSEFADSASYALTSSHAVTASYAVSASHVEFADSSSYAVTSSHAITASYTISSSHSEFADSASYALTSSKAISASYAISASHVEFADSASYAVTSSHAITASYAVSSSHSEFADSSSYAVTSSHAVTASFITGSGVYGPYGSNSIISASWAETSSFITASNIYGPHFTSSVVSASYAITASHILGLIDTVRADFTNQTTFAALHNLNTEDIVVQVYQDDASTGNLPVQIVPDSITLTDLNTATVTFAVATTGYVVISRGGFNRSGSIQDAVSASIANTVQNPLTQGLGVETFSYDGGTAGVIVQVNTSSAHFLSSSVATSSFAQTASYVNTTYRENVAGDVRYAITHNLNEQYPVVQTYDTTTNRQLIPDFVESTGLNTLNIEYAVTFSGIVIVQK